MQKLISVLRSALQAEFGIVSNLEITKSPKIGDFAWCAQEVALSINADPIHVAKRIADAIRSCPEVAAVETVGPYVNITSATLFEDAVDASRMKAAAPTHKGVLVPSQRIMVEYLSPNTNKPLHLGHVRNGVLGSAVANLLDAAGHFVIRANLVNDRGIHICKSMIGWERFGEGSTPASTGIKGDHFVGKYYVEFERHNKAELKACTDSGIAADQAETPLMREAQEMLRKWEFGDEDVHNLWSLMNSWVYAGFQQTYDRYGFTFNTMYYESELYKLGKDIVDGGLEHGVFIRREDGSIAYPLPVAAFGTDADGKDRTATLLRGDGTSLYLTQDLGTAVRKAEDWNLDRSLYVVMSEQNHHFASLFSSLKALGYPWADRCHHLSYEMVELPAGRMKSREGTVVDADDLADEMQALAESVLREKAGLLSEEELKRRANVIGLAAIKFYLLNFGSNRKIKFNPKESISFEGDTGPYCLYSYARVRSVLEKAGDFPRAMTFSRLSDEERALARELVELPYVIRRAAESYNPTLLAKRMIVLSQTLNRYYKQCPILNGTDEQLKRERLTLVEAAAESLKWGLGLLGIETLERM